MFKYAIFSLLLITQIAQGQTSKATQSEGDYLTQNGQDIIDNLPDGIYWTSDAFIHKRPDSREVLTIQSDENLRKYDFFHESNSKKEKQAFAIVLQGEVYLQPKQIVKMLVDDSRGQTWDGGSYYIKARVLGKYLYAEDFFSTTEAGIAGGLIATMAARREKAILYVNHLNKFRVIKNLDHLITFMQAKHPEYTYLVPSIEHIEASYSGPEEKPKEIDYVQHILGQMDK